MKKKFTALCLSLLLLLAIAAPAMAEEAKTADLLTVSSLTMSFPGSTGETMEIESSSTGNNSFYFTLPDGAPWDKMKVQIRFQTAPKARVTFADRGITETADEAGWVILKGISVFPSLWNIALSSADSTAKVNCRITAFDCFSSGFSDVWLASDTLWCFEAVRFVKSAGLFNGTGATTFSPKAPMSRAAFMQVLANRTNSYVKEDHNGSSVFSDVPVGFWGCAPIHWAYENKLTDGVTETTFAPNNSIKREEMVTLLYRYAKATGISTPELGSLSSFADGASVSSWAQPAMRWAIGQGIINGSGGRLSPKSVATRAQVATVFMNAAPILTNYDLAASEENPNPDEDNRPAYDYTFGGKKLFTVYLPEDWARKCSVTNANGFLTFRSASNEEAGFGGRLFQLYATDSDDFRHQPNTVLLKTILLDGKEHFIVCMRPTDVQFDGDSPSRTEEYQSMYDELGTILSQISYEI